MTNLRSVEQSVDPFCQFEIRVGQATLVMSGQAEGDGAPADIDVWVVIRFFGDFGNAIDKIHGFHELVEFEDPKNLGVSLFVLPFWDFSQAAFKFVFLNQI